MFLKWLARTLHDMSWLTHEEGSEIRGGELAAIASSRWKDYTHCALKRGPTY
jgi:hypothetical protein